MAFNTFYRAGDYSRIGLERVYAYFDRLHDIASEGHVREVSNMPPAEILEYLNEVIFTLEETAREIREHARRIENFVESAVNDSEAKEEVQ